MARRWDTLDVVYQSSTAMGRADCHSHLKFPLQGISHSIDQMRLSHNLPATKNLISILFIFARDIGISPKNQSSTSNSVDGSNVQNPPQIGDIRLNWGSHHLIVSPGLNCFFEQEFPFHVGPAPQLHQTPSRLHLSTSNYITRDHSS